MIFGVGVGWNREEMENHGTDPRTRGKLMNERIEAMIAMWTKDEPEFHGEYVDFDPIGLWPKPVQKPYPPIYVGGGSRAFERVAQFGDEQRVEAAPFDSSGQGSRRDSFVGYKRRDAELHVFIEPCREEGIDAHSLPGLQTRLRVRCGG